MDTGEYDDVDDDDDMRFAQPRLMSQRTTEGKYYY